MKKKRYSYCNRDKIIDDLSSLINIASVSGNKVEVTKALKCTLNIARRLGFKAYSLLDNKIGLIEIGGGNETLGILAHVDVVSPGDLSLWKSNPFSCEVRDKCIYGRGTLDDKGPVIAILHAMKAVMECGSPLKKKVQLIIGTQEEIEWTDMEEYVKKYSLPDYGFTPDGDFPICNIEKGCLDITMKFPLEKVSIGSIRTVNSGTASNVVPGKAVVILDNDKKIVAKGKAVHSSMPEKGQNAILIMANKLKNMNIEENILARLFNMIDEKLGDIYGKGIGIYLENEYYKGEFVHRNILTPTVFKTENGFAELSVNIRFASIYNPEKIILAFEKMCIENNGEIVNIETLPSVYVNKERGFVKALVKAYEDITSEKAVFVFGYGASYSKAMPNIVSYGPIFPNSEDTCHEENEYITTNDLLKSVDIYEEAIKNIVFSKESLK